jgi:hypothetical protein
LMVLLWQNQGKFWASLWCAKFIKACYHFVIVANSPQLD